MEALSAAMPTNAEFPALKLQNDCQRRMSLILSFKGSLLSACDRVVSLEIEEILRIVLDY